MPDGGSSRWGPPRLSGFQKEAESSRTASVVVEKVSVLDQIKNLAESPATTTVLKALECLKQPSEVPDEIRLASELLSGHLAKATEEASEVAHEVRAALQLLLDHAAKKESQISLDPSGASQLVVGDSRLVTRKLSQKRVSKTRERGKGKEVAKNSGDPKKATETIENHKLAKKFRGVRYRPNKNKPGGVYAAEIRVGVGQKRIWLSNYKTPEAAAKAHDAATYLRATYFGGKDPEYNYKDSASSFSPLENFAELEKLKDPKLSQEARDKLLQLVKEFAQAAGNEFANSKIGAQQDENLVETADNTERLVSLQPVESMEDERQQEGSAGSMSDFDGLADLVDPATMVLGSMAWKE